MLGMIAFSYGLTRLEPYRANALLAMEATRIRLAERHDVKVAAQWEVALGMDNVDLVIGPYLTAYLDSTAVISEAKSRLFEPLGITEVIPIAQTFLHYRSVCGQLEAAGLTVVKRPIQKTRHTTESLQWWTRGPMRLSLYAARQRLTGYHGKLIVTDQMRRIDRYGLAEERLDHPWL